MSSLVDLVVGGDGFPSAPVRQRARVSGGREHGLHVRLAAEEFGVVAAAAVRVGLTPTGYAGEAAVAAARAAAGCEVADGGVSRAELARVQRELFAARTAVVSVAAALQAVAGMDAADEVASCVSAVARLDEVAARLHGLLKRSGS